MTNVEKKSNASQTFALHNARSRLAQAKRTLMQAREALDEAYALAQSQAERDDLRHAAGNLQIAQGEIRLADRMLECLTKAR